MLFELEYRRIEEGKLVVNAASLEQAKSLLGIELCCGTVPVMRSQLLLINSTELKEGPSHAS